MSWDHIGTCFFAIMIAFSVWAIYITRDRRRPNRRGKNLPPPSHSCRRAYDDYQPGKL